MTDQNSTADLEAAVLAAAAELGQQLDLEVAGIEKYNAALARETELSEQLSVAEEELVDADIAFGQAKKRQIEARRARAAIKTRLREALIALTEAREHLWRVSRSGDKELILAAARDMAEKNLAYWQIAKESTIFEEEESAAEEQMREASEARKAAVQKRGKLKADIEAAQKERGEALTYPGKLFELEPRLVDAACALNDSQDKQFAYSYAHTHDLFGLRCDDGTRPY